MVAHAYTTDRLVAGNSLSYVSHSLLGEIRIAWTVGDEQAVVVNSGEIIIPGNSHHLHASIDEAADNIELYAAVDENHRLVALAIFQNLLAARLCHKILLVGVFEVDIATAFDYYFAKH